MRALAQRARRWHGTDMKPTKRNSLAGGCLLALSVIAGVIWGAYAHQPSIGFLIGLGVGLALSILVWLFDLLR
jgi:hypothetical protein